MEKKRSYLYLAAALTAGLVFSACGSSSGGDGDSSSTKTGYLLDSAIKGISYETDSMSGVTDSSGKFTYKEGEFIEFSLGETSLGMTVGNKYVTALQLTNSSSIDAVKVTNMNRFFQSMDNDGNPENGIDLSHLSDFDASLDFTNESSIANVVTGLGKTMVTLDDANEHFLGTLEETLLKPSSEYTSLTCSDYEKLLVYFEDKNASLVRTNGELENFSFERSIYESLYAAAEDQFTTSSGNNIEIDYARMGEEKIFLSKNGSDYCVMIKADSTKEEPEIYGGKHAVTFQSCETAPVGGVVGSTEVENKLFFGFMPTSNNGNIVSQVFRYKENDSEWVEQESSLDLVDENINPNLTHSMIEQFSMNVNPDCSCGNTYDVEYVVTDNYGQTSTWSETYEFDYGCDDEEESSYDEIDLVYFNDSAEGSDGIFSDSYFVNGRSAEEACSDLSDGLSESYEYRSDILSCSDFSGSDCTLGYVGGTLRINNVDDFGGFSSEDGLSSEDDFGTCILIY
jgi:hypothetical protein